MKKLILTALCGCINTIALSQTTTGAATIKGSVTDSATQKPLSYITLSLKDPLAQQTIKSGLTKPDGTFELVKLPVQVYRLVLIAVGYQTKNVIVPAFNKDEKPVVNLGNIILSASSNQLKRSRR